MVVTRFIAVVGKRFIAVVGKQDQHFAVAVVAFHYYVDFSLVSKGKLVQL